ncbi:MAG: YeeE/YedE family protein [Candidatus Sericytochromatia bacterium]|nr:YeeE/YedE family protein [Candidatus Sericytochromatia bacterium]
MKIYLSAFVSGLIFAIGLGISGMMSPQKVQGFLDLAGRWDPSLALVMGGGLAVTFVTYPLIFKRKAPILSDHFALPGQAKIDPKLIGGAAIFGSGWAISGLCPGPALANLGSFNPGVWAFVGMMLLGFVIYPRLSQIGTPRSLPGVETPAQKQERCEEECVVD